MWSSAAPQVRMMFANKTQSASFSPCWTTGTGGFGSIMANAPKEKKSGNADAERREAQVLKRLLSTPPDHKRKEKADASFEPKKRGRPPKMASETEKK